MSRRISSSLLITVLVLCSAIGARLTWAEERSRPAPEQVPTDERQRRLKTEEPEVPEERQRLKRQPQSDKAAGCLDGESLNSCRIELGAGFTDPRQRSECLCARGVARECNAIAWRRFRGEGYPRDPAASARIWQELCDAGNGEGCLNYAWLLERGREIAEDQELAAKIAQRAFSLWRTQCRRGEGEACDHLGLAHELGRGLKRDAKRAWAYYDRACSAGYEASCRRIPHLPSSAR